MIPDSETFMNMLRNPEQVVSAILKDLETSEKNMLAFAKLETLYEQGKEVNTEKILTASAKSLRHINELNRRILMLLLVYVSGDSYGSDTGKVLLKMGRGKEVLQEMFKRKMSGGWR